MKLAGCGGPVVAGDMSLANLIKKSGKGVKLAEDLTREEARAAMLQILDDSVFFEQVGALLIALRMKGETVEETVGVVQALQDKSKRLSHDFPLLLELASAHDGKTKSAVLSPYVAVILAMAGVPVLLTGGQDVPTKRGMTARQVFEAWGAPVRGSAADVKARLQRHGVAYWDVDDYCPALVRLRDLRSHLGLRTVLNTAEKAVNPGRASHICTGVFHGPYLQDLATVHQALGVVHVLCVQATEASTDLPLKKRVLCRRVASGEISQQFEIDPDALGMKNSDNPALDDRAVYDALMTRTGVFYDALVYNAAVQLWFVGRASSVAKGLQQASQIIASGAVTHKIGELIKS